MFTLVCFCAKNELPRQGILLVSVTVPSDAIICRNG